MNKNPVWQLKSFAQLTTDELYDALKLRVDVFVVEQCCYYPELDDLDRHKDTLHLFCYQQQKMTAYLRILAKGQSYPEHLAIGRVVIAKEGRGNGIGHSLMEKSIDICQQYFPQQPIKISAQAHLEGFYNKHHFSRVSEVYLEDDIPHIAMVRATNDQ